MPAAPEIVDGMRQPRSVRLEDIRKGTEAARTLPVPHDSPEGITVYMSPTRRYLAEVLNVPSYVHEGRRYPAKRISAQFEEGVYRNGAPGTDGYRKPEVKKLIDEELQRNRYFGKFGDVGAHFYLLSDMKATTEEARLKSALNTLKSIPREQLEARLAELRQGDAEDHEFTPATAAEARPAQRPTAKPIAS